MDVLLIKDVDNLGEAGEVVNVAGGYARNFLIPRELAVPATPGAIKQAERQHAAEERQQAREFNEAKALAELVDGTTVTFEARAGETDRLYGSITKAQIAEAIENVHGQEIDRRKIDLDEPIKDLGAHAVTIRFASEAEAKVTVVVEREEEES